MNNPLLHLRLPAAAYGRGGVLRVAELLIVWSLVGIGSALLLLASAAVAGMPLAVGATIVRQWSAALVWVPLTLVIVGLRASFPLTGSHSRVLAVHGTASLLLPLVLNLVLAGFESSDSRSALLPRAMAGYLRWLHITVPLYWIILALDNWRADSRQRGRAPVAAEPSSVAPDAGDPIDCIKLRHGSRVTRVSVDEVVWLQGAGDYVRLHTRQGSRLASCRLRHLAGRLPARFLRIHRSTVIDLNRVREFRPLGHGDYEVTMEGGARLRVSRSLGRSFKAALGNARI